MKKKLFILIGRGMKLVPVQDPKNCQTTKMDGASKRRGEGGSGYDS